MFEIKTLLKITSFQSHRIVPLSSIRFFFPFFLFPKRKEALFSHSLHSTNLSSLVHTITFVARGGEKELFFSFSSMWKYQTAAVCNPVVTQATASGLNSLSHMKQIFKMPNLYYRTVPGDRGSDICATVLVLSA